jgi:drug/metabolite transporter (DMT)-like permease
VSPRRADATLIAATFIWGVTFVVIKDALAAATPLAFLAVRFAVAALVLTPLTPLTAPFTRRELGAGALLAAVLGLGFATQAVGLVDTTPARSAFIVGVSSVLAPPIAFLAVRERAGPGAILALLLAAVGMYLLTDPRGGGLNRGDLWTLVTAACFGGQIVAVAELSRRFDPLRLVWMQTVGTALLAAVAAVALEHPVLHWSARLALQLGWASVFATALALLWQMRAQREMSSARAAIIFCLEAVFAAGASWWWLGERLTPSQWLGGGLILAGMVTAEVRR